LVLAVLEFGLELAFAHRSHSRFSTLPDAFSSQDFVATSAPS